MVACFAVTLALALAASPVPSPSPAKARSFSDADLEAYRGRSDLVPDPGPAPPRTPAAKADEGKEVEGDGPKLDEADERAAQEAQWRQRFADARARIVTEEAACWKTVIEPTLVGGSYKAYYVPMKVLKFEESAALRQAKQALENLHEQLRRAGLPPGWGRE
jgi:hypothetical protein